MNKVIKLSEKKIDCNLYYPINFISIIILMGYIRAKKDHNYKILYLNTRFIPVKLIKFYTKFLLTYFDEIKIITYSRRARYRNKRYLGFIYDRSQDVEKFIKKINIDKKKLNILNIYSGGDDFNFAVYRRIGKVVPTYHVEHGYGLVLNLFSPGSRVSLSRFLQNFFSKILYHLKILNYYPIKFDGYISVIFSRIKCKPRFNNRNIRAILVNKKNINYVISQYANYVLKKKQIKIKKKNYVFLNSSHLKVPKNINETNDLIKKIIKLINKKKDIIVIKDHPNFRNKPTKFNKYLFKSFKEKRIKFVLLRNNFLSTISTELFIYIYNIKKLISDISSSPLFSKIFFKSLKCFIFYDYTEKHHVKPEEERIGEAKKIIQDSFKDIKYI